MTTVPGMHPDEFIDAIRADGTAMSAMLADETVMATPVPSCPGWDVEKLVGHLGRVHRWVATMVQMSAGDRVGFPARPDVIDAKWFEEGVSEVTAALVEAGPDVKMFTFPNGGGTSRFWFRRQAEETAVHRWDLEHALGRARPIETEVAIAGVDEMLDVFLASRSVELGGSVHFHATDSDHGEWIVTVAEDGALVVGHGHEKGDVAIRAAASDLLLWLWGRPVPKAGLEVFGDEAILDQWRGGLSMA